MIDHGTSITRTSITFDRLCSSNGKIKQLESANGLASLTRNTRHEYCYPTCYKHVAYSDADCTVAKTDENVKQAWQTRHWSHP